MSIYNRIYDRLSSPKQIQIKSIDKASYKVLSNELKLQKVTINTWPNLENDQMVENYGAGPCLSIYFIFKERYIVGHFAKDTKETVDECRESTDTTEFPADLKFHILNAKKQYDEMMSVVAETIQDNREIPNVYIFGQNYYPREDFGDTTLSAEAYEQNIGWTDKVRADVLQELEELEIPTEKIFDNRSKEKPFESGGDLVDNVIFDPSKKIFYLNRCSSDVQIKN